MQFSTLLTREQAPAVLLALLFGTFILLLPRFTDAAKTPFALLILVASIHALARFRQLGKCDGAERLFLAAVVVNFLWMAFSFYYNGSPGRGDTYLWGRHFYFLFLVPMFFMFRRIPLHSGMLVACIAASLLVSLADIAIDYLRGISYRDGGMNMNKFGPIQLCLVGILACYLPCLDARWKKFLAGSAIIAGLATVILSASKASWLAIPVLCVFFIYYLQKQWSVARKTLVTILVMALLASSYFLPLVKIRIDHLQQNAVAFINGEANPELLGTFVARMYLWRAGWAIFTEQPITGAGLGSLRVKMKENHEHYQIPESVTRFKYTHNQYLSALVTRGIPGLILLLLVLIMPLYIAMNHKAKDREERAAQLSLLFIGITYLVVNLPDDHFEGKSATMFLSVMLALLLARISSGANQLTGAER